MDAEAPPCVEIDDDGDDGPVLPPEYDVVVSPVDFTVKALCGMVDSGRIVLPHLPDEHAWDVRTASRLVESLLVGLPVPPVYVLEQGDDPQLVIDGFRRLGAVRAFLAGRLGDGVDGPGAQEFRLAGVGSGDRLAGRTFSGLDAADRNALENAVLRTVIVRQMNPDDNPLVGHDLFERLNTRRELVRGHEARRRVYHGGLADLVDELGGLGRWRALLGPPRPEWGCGGEELILRYMALLRCGEEYGGNMRGFLSSFMRRNRDPTCAFACEERARFARACDVLGDRIGTLPLGGDGHASPSVCDALLVSVAERPDECDDPGLASRLRNLLSDPEFARCTAPARDDPASVRRRLALARGRLRA